MRHEVRALDASEARSTEAGAVRVLVAGSGITTGWGVSTHGLALIGAVQRSLQHRLHAPVDAVQASRIGALLADAPDVLVGHLDATTDVVVLAFGWSDVFALTPVHRWKETLAGVLDLLALQHPGLRFVVVGVPPMNRLGIASLLGPLVRRHGEHLNDGSRDVVGSRPDTAFVELEAPVNREARPWGSPEAYHAWSLPIAAGIAAMLHSRGRSARTGHAAPAPHPQHPVQPLEHPDLLSGLRVDGPQVPDAGTAQLCVPPTIGRRVIAELPDRISMRTWVHDYALRVLEDLSHPPLTSEHGGPCRTLVVGTRPLRVLFFGAGLAIGYGVRTRADAVDGPFAAALAVSQNRGVVLENRAEQHLRLDQTAASLGAIGTYSYDLAVWFPSFTDGIRRLRPSWWRNHLRATIRRLRTRDHVPLLLTHMPLPAGLHPAAVIARPWVRRLNRTIDQVAAEWDDVSSAPTAPFYPGDIGQKVTDRTYFRNVSDQLLPAANRLLRAPSPTRTGPQRRHARPSIELDAAMHEQHASDRPPAAPSP